MPGQEAANKSLPAVEDDENPLAFSEMVVDQAPPSQCRILQHFTL
jgi:hypothetical protein